MFAIVLDEYWNYVLPALGLNIIGTHDYVAQTDGLFLTSNQT
jgi:hypothetical protein